MPAERHPNMTRPFLYFVKMSQSSKKSSCGYLFTWFRIENDATYTHKQRHISSLKSKLALQIQFLHCLQIETCMQKLLAFATSSRLLFRSCEGMILAIACRMDSRFHRLARSKTHNEAQRTTEKRPKKRCGLVTRNP